MIEPIKNEFEIEPEIEENKKLDPRFKSPDELLVSFLANRKEKKVPAIEHAETESRIPEEIPKISNPILNSPKMKSETKQNFEFEITQWKQYERNVILWRDRVLGIVSALKAEVSALKSVIETKDEEIEKLQKKAKKKK